MSDHRNGKVADYPIHPAAELFPLMTGREQIDLACDIGEHGLREPIVLLDGKILDGRNRLKACKLALVEPRFVEVTSADLGGSASDYVVSKNLHRRHLNAKQKRDVIKAVLKENPAQSDRQAAKKTKTDNKTVASVRKEMERREEIPHVETRKDSQGRAQPAKKPASDKKRASAPKADPPAQPAAKDTKDSSFKNFTTKNFSPKVQKPKTPEEQEREDAKLQAAVRSLKEQAWACDESLRRRREAQRKGFAPPSKLDIEKACVRELSDDDKTAFGRWWNYDRLQETKGGAE
jgi:ParB-like chromosome segregation protein Spo0J